MHKVIESGEHKPALPMAISIASGKGGVGKSSIALNTAISLAKAGARVCLFDADTGLANINILLGLMPQFSLEHVLFGAKSIEEVMLDGPFGMKIVPGAHGMSECVDLHPRQQLRLLRELARIESEFDYLLIDTAAGISRTTLDFVTASQHSIIVITPEPTSLTDAFSLVKLLHRRRAVGLSFHVVVNMCASTGQAKEIFHRFAAAVEKYIGVEIQYLGFILRDESMRTAVSLQSPVALFPDHDPSSRSFIRLADSLQQSVKLRPPRRSFSGFWQQRYREQQADNSTSKNKPSAAPSSTQYERDQGYLSELHSRLTMLISRETIDRERLRTMLNDVIDVFTEHYGDSPVDPLALIDSLLLSPDRNDRLLRDIAEKVQSWNASQSPPLVELFPAAEQPISASAVVVNTESNPHIALPAMLDSRHRYDSSRFGSQQQLIELLRQSREEPLELVDMLARLS